jgi:trimethylamine--corrinoid protein Co-methyltransferase
MTKICSNQYAMHSPYARKLSDDQCQKLYWACLEILEHTGVRMYEQEALDLLKKALSPHSGPSDR